jgi:hypothetical protein
VASIEALELDDAFTASEQRQVQIEATIYSLDISTIKAFNQRL